MIIESNSLSSNWWKEKNEGFVFCLTLKTTANIKIKSCLKRIDLSLLQKLFLISSCLQHSYNISNGEHQTGSRYKKKKSIWYEWNGLVTRQPLFLFHYGATWNLEGSKGVVLIPLTTAQKQRDTYKYTHTHLVNDSNLAAAKAWDWYILPSIHLMTSSYV